MTERDLIGRTFLVTGANTGIGRATAQGLAARGGRVILACRDQAKAEATRAAIAGATGSDELALLELDLADLAAVRAAAERHLAGGEQVDVLILNAGLAGQRGQTADGFELAFGVNHLGHFLFADLLLDHLRAGSDPRLVVVASDSHFDAPGIDLEAVQRPTKSITGLPEYAVSKLANVCFAQELARRVPADELAVHALHPGVIASDVWRRVPWPVRPIMTRFMRSVEEGAETSLHCATASEAAGRSGLYWSDRAVKESSAVATPELGAELWEASERWTA